MLFYEIWQYIHKENEAILTADTNAAGIYSVCLVSVDHTPSWVAYVISVHWRSLSADWHAVMKWTLCMTCNAQYAMIANDTMLHRPLPLLDVTASIDPGNSERCDMWHVYRRLTRPVRWNNKKHIRRWDIEREIFLRHRTRTITYNTLA